MAIRPVRRDEAASLREIRLRALGDAPQAYFASLESEEGLPLSYWEDWATSEDKVVFVAEEDGSWLGMAGAFVHPDKRGTVSLWWLWLAPSARHRSLGFVPTGERRSMASDPTRVGIFMARPL
jgi:GNAT superfamily N-acetyltransferase